MTVTVNPRPTITLVQLDTLCFSATSTSTATFPYTATTSSPTTYTVTQLTGPTTITGLPINAALPASPIAITFPAAAATGNYTFNITVATAAGCSSTNKTLTVYLRAVPNININGTTTPLCFSGSPQTVNFPYSGATGTPTKYTITADAANPTAVTGLPVNAPLPASPIQVTLPAVANPGTYNFYLTVCNNFGCVSSVKTLTIVVSPPATVNILCSNPLNTVCSGGSVQLTAVVGGSATSGIWNATSGTFSNPTGLTTLYTPAIASGTINVQFTTNDPVGACQSATAFIPINVIQLQTTTSTTNVACNGGANGTATVNVTGGSGNYTYTWSNLQNTQTATGLAAGTYSVVVNDVTYGCTKTTSVTITQPAVLVAASTAGTISCNGGTTTVTVTATGGTAPYTGTGTFPVNAGAYSFTVTDANGCTSITTGTVTEPTNLVASSTAGTISCNGGTTTVTVTAIGGTAPYTGTGTFPVNAGAYSFTVTDANGCTSITTGTVTEPTNLVASSTAGTISCNGWNNNSNSNSNRRNCSLHRNRYIPSQCRCIFIHSNRCKRLYIYHNRNRNRAYELGSKFNSRHNFL